MGPLLTSEAVRPRLLGKYRSLTYTWRSFRRESLRLSIRGFVGCSLRITSREKERGRDALGYGYASVVGVTFRCLITETRRRRTTSGSSARLMPSCRGRRYLV